ncbi:hypothetical protein J5N97_000996 [Dioscorea zingiberensis]|uniref:ferredoxin--NADP(+) reductase n=1 Tax=Dioscorea zingiberensis TaxID=325984 RepID=A0A9D5H2M2_9LILI|nr:hypothetical protein J5N97_000996 [Dioscorea zingiberensis]
MALKVDLCSVMHAKMLPGKGLGFNHSGSQAGIGEICHIVLNHGGKFSFVEGQFLHVHFQSVLRDFSIASSRNGDSFDGQTLSLCVRRADLTEQSVSNYLCNLKPGDEVQISGPVDGKMVFVQEPPEGKHIMVGTATGIAPFRSNLQRLFVDPNSGVTFNGLAAWLISGADDYNSLLYDNEFTQIEKDNSYHFKYQRALNNSVDDSIYEGRDEIFRLLNGGAYIYFAGSKSMMPEILEIFEKIAQEKVNVSISSLPATISPSRAREACKWVIFRMGTVVSSGEVFLSAILVFELSRFLSLPHRVGEGVAVSSRAIGRRPPGMRWCVDARPIHVRGDGLLPHP